MCRECHMRTSSNKQQAGQKPVDCVKMSASSRKQQAGRNLLSIPNLSTLDSKCFCLIFTGSKRNHIKVIATLK